MYTDRLTYRLDTFVIRSEIIIGTLMNLPLCRCRQGWTHDLLSLNDHTASPRWSLEHFVWCKRCQKREIFLFHHIADRVLKSITLFYERTFFPLDWKKAVCHSVCYGMATHFTRRIRMQKWGGFLCRQRRFQKKSMSTLKVVRVF